MTENDRVFDAFRNCITEPKCRNCPWTECDTLKNRVVEIPIDLALAVMRMLKAQEPKTVQVIGNVGVSNVKFADCPWCAMRIHDDESQRYCGHCGRAVKWE